MADDRSERTEQPTAKRLDEARRKGNIPRTAEASVAMSALVLAGFLTWGASAWFEAFRDLLAFAAAEMRPAPWTAEHAAEFARHLTASYAMLAGPPILLAAVGGIAVNLAQVGPLVSSQPLEPRWSVLNPITGFGRIFGIAALASLAKAPLKFALLGLIAYWTVQPALATLLLGTGASPFATLAAIGDVVLSLLWRIGLAQAALSVLDYGYQRWQHRRNLRMTKQEVKDESKQAEGDPNIRARFRSLHRQYATRRMMQDVARADVVVTNPTHLAVAIKYEFGMRAPKVLAKGARLVAERIRERAREAGVPVVEHRPLAQALYKAVPVGGEIPAPLYRAVAEVLAYVWALRHRAAGG